MAGINLSSLSLEILHYFGGYYDYVCFLLALAVHIFKGKRPSPQAVGLCSLVQFKWACANSAARWIVQKKPYENLTEFWCPKSLYWMKSSE